MPQKTTKNHLPQWMADTPNPAPVTHRAYVLLDEVAQEGCLYACDAQAQASMNLRDGNNVSGKPVSPKGAAWPYVRSDLISDSLELIPLNGNKSTAAKSIRDGRAIRNARANAKRGHKRLNCELDLRDGEQARPAPKGRDKGAAA
ncbi:hypothetical protein [Phaeobacter gallaeciensis]|uniref:hypothetical protein n=1 Tax=Phaeobacter gallaeciensis TaxID=60890 RepID=UPI00237F67AB|nr:hypothetical protein [Phaeobacter gallaeciensis]MDE4140964.1 hypothetical protein [Phaeobacter gallaeciensis]MDE4149409.1 hypothetical protein [Phaeobacter gallaeciensis]MDE4153398.1 hypothetical protein [Phaeobacter gallaeciensis]MDE4228787.1 hypothetical protein [Phaeobacter gallaeciensis]MDE4257862.1 hypothetical protein [Phaeobacter gallaeciensis]